MKDMEAISFIDNKLEGIPFTEVGKAITYLYPTYDSFAHAELELFNCITLYAAFRKSEIVEIPTVGVEYEDEDTIIVNEEYFNSAEFWLSENKELRDCLYINWR